MGYSTTFQGELKFATEPTTEQLSALAKMFGEDCRDHPEWGAPVLYHIDLELSETFDGIKWDGAEKTYDMDKLVNVVLRVMRETWPQFGLVGTLHAQGEDVQDRWMLTIGQDGWAHKVPIALTCKIVTCPHCDQRFALEG